MLIALPFLLALSIGLVFGASEPDEDLHFIIGGSDLNINSAPYQVSIRLNGQHTCGGSILTQRHVLTAAHCVQCCLRAPYNRATVVTGATTRLPSDGDQHRIYSAVMHAGYSADSFGMRNDIAVITLLDPIQFSNRAQPISLPTRDVTPGTYALITGWGFRVYRPRPEYPTNLQYVYMRLMSNSDCQYYFTYGNFNYRINEDEVCALEKVGVGTCQGDSGGPAVVDNQVVGIVSWGIPCAVGYPSVFTRVYPLVPWVKSMIGQQGYYYGYSWKSSSMVDNSTGMVW